MSKYWLWRYRVSQECLHRRRRCLRRSCGFSIVISLSAPAIAMVLGAGSVRLAHAQLTVDIVLASRAALPGQTIPIPVFLDTAGFDLFGVENHIELESGTYIPPLELTGRVECRMTQFSPRHSAFGRVPPSCMPDRDCIGVRALILGFVVGDFENGELYRCNVAVARDASPGTYRLRCTNAGTASFIPGEPLPTVCSDGEIRVTDRAGDCDGDGLVTIDELVRGVAVTMGELALEECAPLDGDLDGRARVNDVVRAVASALG